MTIKLLIVDDHPMVREGLVAMLGNCMEIEIVGSGHSSEEAQRMTKSLKPDVILMDIKMKGVNGIETARQILANFPHIRVIFLTVFEDTESIRLALQSGAAGYLLKHITREKLMDTINRVYRGETIIDQSVFQQIVSDYTRLSKRISDDSDITEGHTRKQIEKQDHERMLTPREQEILYHLARGLTNKEISAATNLAVDTVKTHLRNIFRKLGVKNRTQAISKAIKMGSTIPIYAPSLKTEDA
ncbi:MAG TPA: DNA-binding response regulator [Firmicutes bacterium]|nr:DNA-binding response regulator [Bacillota bacterium]